MSNLERPRRILITGASRGIGRETAIQLAQRGHRVVLAARSKPQLTALAAQLETRGGECEVAPVDVTKPASVRECVAQVLERGALDVLVNCAGSLHQSEFHAQSDEVRRREMELNYFGALAMTEAVLPAFMQVRAGAIVNVSSMLGSVGTPTTANYCASKAALQAFTHGLRGEVARFGITTTVFVAPHTRTELGAQADFEGIVSMPVEFVARELVRAIEHTPRSHAAGWFLRVGLRLAAWCPRLMEGKLQKMVQHRLGAPAPVKMLHGGT